MTPKDEYIAIIRTALEVDCSELTKQEYIEALEEIRADIAMMLEAAYEELQELEAE